MCGIAGVFSFDPRVRVPQALLDAMVAAQRHRGPDAERTRAGPGYGFAHNRLAIVDLSPAGVQPMADASGRIWVTFNGEIYNWLALRGELEAKGYRFRTRTDTEVLLHGWDAWRTELPAKLRGMFAFAILDERTHSLFLARDRLGKKPLHWRKDAAGLAFASEIKGLLCDAATSRALDHEALLQFLCLRYVPDPRTIFRDVKKLPPAHWLLAEQGALRIEPYWRLSFAATSAEPTEVLAERTLADLDEAVRLRLMGDVPLGAFLSGGIDSHAVVESMARASTKPVVACTIGFPNKAWDERPHARAAAARCGATLHEDLVEAKDLADLAWFADTFDEPFADSSAIPTWHVSRMARRHVTVALSGDGGDESFAGYRRYKFDRIENRVRSLLPAGVWSGLSALYPKADFLPRAVRFKRTLANLGKSPEEAYARSVSATLPEQVQPLLARGLALAGIDALLPIKDAYRAADGPDALARATAADFATWLPGDILVKVDRASMAVSLEVRAPFLDHVLVEHAARIPSRTKLSRGRTKGFLRDTLAPRLDAQALRRAKRGFSVPMRRWLAAEVGDALDVALGEGVLAPLLDVGAVRALLVRHRSGFSDHSEILWAAFVLDRFLRRWVR